MRFIVRVDVPGGIDASKLGEEPTAETPLATISGRDVLRPERKRELLVVPVSQVLLSRMGGKAKAYFKARFADGSLELVDPVVDQGW